MQVLQSALFIPDVAVFMPMMPSGMPRPYTPGVLYERFLKKPPDSTSEVKVSLRQALKTVFFDAVVVLSTLIESTEVSKCLESKPL